MSNSSNSLMEKLLLYKEMIAICAMFFGGLVFLYTYFATKSSLEEAKCFLNANVIIARNQSKMAELRRLERYHKEAINEIENKKIRTIREEIRLENFNETRDEIKEELKDRRQKVREAEELLASGSCKKAEFL